MAIPSSSGTMKFPALLDFIILKIDANKIILAVSLVN